MPPAEGSIQRATLLDAGTVDYVWVSSPPAGGMKSTYFTPDRKHVVQFYHDNAGAIDPQRFKRLQTILFDYNPTFDSNHEIADFWRQLYCWPVNIVVAPQLGLVAPAYPDDFFFKTGKYKGLEKKGKWFSSPRLNKWLSDAERGTWVNYFQICILIARAVRRLHVRGLAHSDLSGNNVLIDPSHGRAIVIDIDSLVVPVLFPPDVMGTRGYIAPEVLRTMSLSLRDPKREHPNIKTDLHALAVLIYEYLLNRHPLDGKKVRDVSSAEKDDLLSLGQDALFVEHPSDHSNPPHEQVHVPFTALGPYLRDLFLRAFVEGLHNPDKRPTAIEWEGALVRTWDLLFPCVNPSCSHKYFVLDPANVQCSFCGRRPSGTIPLLKLCAHRGQGEWRNDRTLVVYPGIRLFKWHAFSDQFPKEGVDKTPQAYCMFHNGSWVMVNQDLASLTSPGGSRVPIGHAVELRDGVQIQLSQEPSGRMVHVQMLTV